MEFWPFASESFYSCHALEEVMPICSVHVPIHFQQLTLSDESALERVYGMWDQDMMAAFSLLGLSTSAM